MLKEKIEAFVKFLEVTAKINPGLLAKIRRARYPVYFEVGKFIYHYLPTENDSVLNRNFLFVANLFSMHPMITRDCSIGECFSKLRDAFSEDGTDNKIKSWLSCKTEMGIFHKLKVLVRMSDGKKIPLNWSDLLWSLCNWDSDNLWVQNKIAKDMWKNVKIDKLSPEPETEKVE